MGLFDLFKPKYKLDPNLVVQLKKRGKLQKLKELQQAQKRVSLFRQLPKAIDDVTERGLVLPGGIRDPLANLFSVKREYEQRFQEEARKEAERLIKEGKGNLKRLPSASLLKAKQEAEKKTYGLIPRKLTGGKFLAFDPLGFVGSLESKISRNLFKRVALSKKPETIKSLIKPLFKDISDDVLEQTAKKLSSINKVKEVEKELGSLLAGGKYIKLQLKSKLDDLINKTSAEVFRKRKPKFNKILTAEDLHTNLYTSDLELLIKHLVPKINNFVDNIKPEINSDVIKKLTPPEKKIADLVFKAWEINSIVPHSGRTAYNALLYKQKERLLKEAVRLSKKIKSNNIKIWEALDNNSFPVTYFNIGGRQLSFHKSYGAPKGNFEEWIGTKTLINPLRLSKQQYQELAEYKKNFEKLNKIFGVPLDPYENPQKDIVYDIDKKLIDYQDVKNTAKELAQKYNIDINDLLEHNVYRDELDLYKDEFIFNSLSDKLQKKLEEKTGLSRKDLFLYFPERQSEFKKSFTRQYIKEIINDKIKLLKRRLSEIEEEISLYKTKTSKGRLKLVKEKKNIIELLNKLTNEKEKIIEIFEDITKNINEDIKKTIRINEARKEFKKTFPTILKNKDFYSQVAKQTKKEIKETGEGMVREVKPEIKLLPAPERKLLPEPKPAATTIKEARQLFKKTRETPEFVNILKTGKKKIITPINEKIPQEPIRNFDNHLPVNRPDFEKLVPEIKNEILQKVATKTTKSGKKIPIIRKSGFYAHKEIETAPIRDVYSNFKSPTNMALQQDGLGEGKFGSVYRYIWKPTKEAIAQNKKFYNLAASKIKSLAKKYNVKITKKNGELLADALEGKNLQNIPDNIKQLAKEIRVILDKARGVVNHQRRLLGKEEIGYIKNYLPHLQKTTLWSQLVNDVTISEVFDFIVPNQTKNPHAYKRLLKELPNADRNAFYLLDRYFDAISKELYYTPAIENIKAHIAALKDRGLFRAARYWEEYIREGLVGKSNKLDITLNVSKPVERLLQKFRNMLNSAYLTGNLGWSLLTQWQSTAFTLKEAGIRNTVKAFTDVLKSGIRKSIQENSKVLQIKSSDLMSTAVAEGRNLGGKIYRSPIQKYNDFISLLGSAEEKFLTEWSFAAGLKRARQLGLKGEDALEFADIVAERSQSMYNRENRALILNSKLLNSAFPFQSFSIEAFNHALELLTKSRGAVSLTRRERLGKAIRLMVGIYLANKIYESATGRKKTTIGSFVPYGGQMIDYLAQRAKGKKYYGTGRAPVSQVQIMDELIRAFTDYVKYGSTKRLREFGIKYGLAAGGIGGGTQINRIIDAIIADIEGEVKDVRGKKMFEIKGMDKIRAPLFGVWNTEAGKEYWQKRQPKKKTKLKLKK